MTHLKNDLNLARKWRPKDFNHIIGQDLSMRMLKNSLYLKKFFPVYLFSGQRGCGKTSTARVFATAINCSHLSIFQTDPTITIPCLQCPSCMSMMSSQHPDFIEIDAASHTGVDNVRTIIESSSYIPLIGEKKIYLIDEAHMLSKAAFNAFLKILEEPPISVLFILATTEMQKIPTTVLSRCFQLVFNPIETKTLKQHLQTICSEEFVDIESGALDLIIDETEGSARDAINLLERVRFSGTTITTTSVLHVLGKIGNTDLIKLFDTIVTNDGLKILQCLANIKFEHYSATILWDMLVDLCRMLLWIKYGVAHLSNSWENYRVLLSSLASRCSINRLQQIMHLLWQHEELFLRTSKKHVTLELILLKMCLPIKTPNEDGNLKTLNEQFENKIQNPEIIPPQKKIFEEKNIIKPIINQTVHKDDNINTGWKNFLNNVTTLTDQLLQSILLQATPVTPLPNDNQSTLFQIYLSSHSSFFINKIDETKQLWLPLLQKTCGTQYQGFLYSHSIKTDKKENINLLSPSIQPLLSNKSTKDPSQFPTASLLLRHFPGKIKKI